MSNYGQQPPYGQTPYGPQTPYGQPQQPQPYGRPAQAPYGQPQQPYGGPANPYAPPQPGQAPGQPGQGQPYGQGYAPQQQWAPQPPQAGPPPIAKRALVVVTMDSVPGRVVSGVVGDVLGVVARSRELPRELRTANPVEGYAQVLTRSRQDAVDAMVAMAQAAGADAVVGLRYDCSEITQTLSEVSAYGTAVTLQPAAEASTGTADEAASSSAPAEHAPVKPLDPPDFVGNVDVEPDRWADAEPGTTPGSAQPAPEGPGSRPGSPTTPGAPTQPWPPAQWPNQG
jgi:uncharacterized protein YbjQ (UPF0145 family)